MPAANATTLNIEATSVRLLTVRNGEVQKWGENALETGLVQDGLILDPPGVGNAIDELFSSQGVGKKRVMACLTGLRAIPRILELPKIDQAQLSGAIRREARREMPVGLDDLYLSWQIIDEDETKLHVYLLGVPRDLLDAQVQAMRNAGIKPHMMDLKPLSLIRAVNKREAIIGDMEPESMDVIIVSNDVPSIMRTIALSEETIDEKLERLSEELRRTIKFHNDSRRYQPLDPSTPVYLTGSLMTDRSLVDRFSNLIDRPTAIPSLPLEYPSGFPTARYMVNVGLALK